MISRFTITQARVDRFVELTGDRNSMHVSEEFARRFRFRRPVVHGMLPFSHLISLLKSIPEMPLDLFQCNTRFLKPVFVGDRVRLEAELSAAEDDYLYEAKWLNDQTGELLIKSSGRLRASNSANAPQAAPPGDCLLIDPISENDLAISDLPGRSERLRFRITEPLQRLYCEDVLGSDIDPTAHVAQAHGMTPNLMAVVLLSTMVGMRLPGRYATFSGFQLSFETSVRINESVAWDASVLKATPITESAELSVSAIRLEDGAALATGTLSTMVNPPARAGISCETIRQNYLDLGLRGKVAIITGSSRGIGAATAKLLAMHGAKVVVNYHQGRADAEAVVSDIRSAGGEAIALKCDIADAVQVKALIAGAVAEWGTVHVLVNNAVKDTQACAAMDLDWPDMLSELNVTLKGMHLCCREVVPLFKAQGGGKIINLSTVFVDNPVKGQTKYITAKSAVVGYAKSLAKELAADNIQVNVLAPNMTSTDLLAGLPTEIVRRMGLQRPGKRNMDPVEVAQAVAFLASQWSNSMNGQKLVLNMGEPPFA